MVMRFFPQGNFDGYRWYYFYYYRTGLPGAR
jgi:hypothetical protein